MSVSVIGCDFHILKMRTRMPFKYGIATLTALPHLFVSVELRVDGATATGIAADGLPPKWFTKNPNQPFADELDAMLDVAWKAGEHIRAAGERETVFELWRSTYAAQEAWSLDTSYPPLLWAFGVTLIERATIDAFCRATHTTFADAVRDNTLGIRLGDIYPEFGDADPAAFLPREPSREITVRHTVGLADPLTDSDIFDEDRLDDGLPQALDECIRQYGLNHFKIKVNGHYEGDLERLRRLAEVIGTATGGDFRFTLDGNEQFWEVEALRAFWHAACNDDRIGGFMDRIIFVEQPFHRSVALTDEIGETLRAWTDRPPVIIDESDGELTSLSSALERGYAGTSHKNCKGVFKGIANACLIARRAADDLGGTYIVSAEDLANVGPVALNQDLAVLATLGIPHAERNGHHYFRGLSMVPDDLQAQVLERHADLYRRHRDGYPTLDVSGGRIDVGSVVDAPFGVAVDPNPSRFAPASDWHADSLNAG